MRQINRGERNSQLNPLVDQTTRCTKEEKMNYSYYAERAQIQEKIFYILEQLQHCDGLVLHDRTGDQNSGLHY